MLAREKEIRYLEDICQLHENQKAGIKNSRFARLNKHDRKKIDELLLALQNPDSEITTDNYEKNCTKKTGLPVWVRCSPLYRELSATHELDLPEHTSSFLEKCIRFIDTIKRFTTDLTEDTISTLRAADLLATISEFVMRGIVGGLNLLNLVFEFGKSFRDLINALSSDEKYRRAHATEAGFRNIFALAGIIICALYLSGIVILPVSLVIISAVTIPIFFSTVIKNTYLYYKAQQKEKESSDPVFIDECNQLANQTELTFLEEYQLATMQHRIDTDKENVLDTERELSFATIEMLSYFFIAAGSVIGLAIFYNPFILQIASKAALGVTIAGVAITTGVKIFQLVDDYLDNKPTKFLRNLFANLFAEKPAMTPMPTTVLPAPDSATSSEKETESEESIPSSPQPAIQTTDLITWMTERQARRVSLSDHSVFRHHTSSITVTATPTPTDRYTL